MVDDVKAAVTKDGACEDARKDATSIRDAFDHKGVREAWDILRQERANAKNLSADDQDVWEKELVKGLNGGDGKKSVLPALSIAYLDANKDALSDSHGYIDKREVRYTKDRLDDGLRMEKIAGKDLGTDDVEAMLAGGAYDLTQKKTFDQINAVDEMRRHFWQREQTEDEAVRTDHLSELLDNKGKETKQEFGFQQTREANKQIAEKLSSDSKLFNFLDEANGDNSRDKKITTDEVATFLKHIDKSPEFKAVFSADELKTMTNPDNYKDRKSTLLTAEAGSGFWSISPTIEVTKETIEKTTGHAMGTNQIGKALSEAGKVVGETGAKAIDEKAIADKAKIDEHKQENKAENKEAHKSTDGPATKKEEKGDKGTREDKKKETAEKQEKTVDSETRLVNDAVQKSGEGPYQVAARMLRGQHDAAAQAALTQILKEQLIEDTGSKDYKEAVSKLKVGHQFLTCEGLEKLREKAKGNGNATLIKLFGSPATKQAVVDNAENYEEMCD